jgi:choline dehydrogenase-like flavoprotein
MNPGKERICIIGCGTYGSYLLYRLLELHGDTTEVTVVEVGNATIRDIEEAGLATPSDTSAVSRFGRYFGLGGTSARWGGQILFFDRRDVARNDNADWDYVVELNERHRRTVLQQLLGKPTMSEQPEPPRVKHGIWLGYFRRNLFKRLGAKQRKRVEWITGHRVVDFHREGDRLHRIDLRDRQGNTRHLEADTFYLTAGALESWRLLDKFGTEALRDGDLGRNLGDHVSVELFRVQGSPPVLGGVDFTPRFLGMSLFTKRLLVDTAGARVNFAHVIPNKGVAAFAVLKNTLFGRQEARTRWQEVMQSLSFLVAFGGKLLLRRKLHIHKNRWSLQLDIEQGDETDNYLTTTEERDAFGERGLRLQWSVSESDRAAITEAKAELKKVLDAAGHDYEEVFTDVNSYEKLEDTYHPVGFIRMGADERAPVDRDFRVRGIGNLYHFSTALFRSAKSINPTAAAFCLIEEHLSRPRRRPE